MVTHSERLRYLGQRMKTLNGEPITLSSRNSAGIVVSLEVPLAVPQLIDPDEQLGTVALTNLELQDWFIDVADYGILFPPRENHFIENAAGELYQCISLGVDESLFRYVTSKRDRIRVHTKRVRGLSGSSDSQYLVADDTVIIVDDEYIE